MRDTLTVGLENHVSHVVTREMAPGHLKRVVLSTPAMIGLIEKACHTVAQEHLDDSETTVGTHVCVSHESAVFEGEQFQIRCRLETIEGRRLNFIVDVEGPKGVVSRGTHHRVIIKNS
jgi:fluoroacetyl-CoA thioesterase